MGLESIFGNFDARPPIYLIHFKWTFDVDMSTPNGLLSHGLTKGLGPGADWAGFEGWKS